MYIEHNMSTVGTFWNTNLESNVVIQEIEDEAVLVEKPRSFTRLLLEGNVQEICENFESEQPDAGGLSNLNAESEQPDVGGPSVKKTFVSQVDEEFFHNNLDPSDRVNEVEVDMTDFKDHCERDDYWLMKGVEVGVGDLEINEEVVVIDFDQYDSGSDGDVTNQKLRKLNKQVKCPFYPGKDFMDPKQIRMLVKKHVVESRREFKYVKNDGWRIRVCCFGKVPCYKKPENNIVGESSTAGEKNKVEKGKKVIDQSPTCPWTLLVSKAKQDKHWYVKTLIEEHKFLQTRELKWASSTYLSQHIGDTIANNPNISGRALQDQLQKQFQLGIDKQVVYKAKNKAMRQLRGNYVEQYSNLRSYVLELQSRNPGTTMKLEVEDEPNPETTQIRVFKRIYICLGPLKRGFKAAGRELLGLDGAFMKGPFPGQVLTAVSVDADNGIYPLAYAIVEVETKHSWTWFLNCLGEDLDLTSRSNFTFISDRQNVFTLTFTVIWIQSL